MTITNRPRARWMVLAMAVTLGACNKSSDADKIPLGANEKMPKDSVHAGMTAPAAAPAEVSPAAKVALDSGNALFRKKDYDKALEQYRIAAKASPDHAAPWFGINMVAGATKNKALGDSALAEIRKRNAVEPHTGNDSGSAAAAHKKAGLKVGAAG